MQVKRALWYILYPLSPCVLCLLYASYYTPLVCVCELPHAYKCVGDANGATVVCNIICPRTNPQLIPLPDINSPHRNHCTMKLGEILIPLN